MTLTFCSSIHLEFIFNYGMRYVPFVSNVCPLFFQNDFGNNFLLFGAVQWNTFCTFLYTSGLVFLAPCYLLFFFFLNHWKWLLTEVPSLPELKAWWGTGHSSAPWGVKVGGAVRWCFTVLWVVFRGPETLRKGKEVPVSGRVRGQWRDDLDLNGGQGFSCLEKTEHWREWAAHAGELGKFLIWGLRKQHRNFGRSDRISRVNHGRGWRGRRKQIVEHVICQTCLG